MRHRPNGRQMSFPSALEREAEAHEITKQDVVHSPPPNPPHAPQPAESVSPLVRIR